MNMKNKCNVRKCFVTVLLEYADLKTRLVI